MEENTLTKKIIIEEKINRQEIENEIMNLNNNIENISSIINNLEEEINNSNNDIVKSILLERIIFFKNEIEFFENRKNYLNEMLNSFLE